jgi:hypothetical protein
VVVKVKVRLFVWDAEKLLGGLGGGWKVKADVIEVDSSTTGRMIFALMRNRQIKKGIMMLSIDCMLTADFRG